MCWSHHGGWSWVPSSKPVRKFRSLLRLTQIFRADPQLLASSLQLGVPVCHYSTVPRCHWLCQPHFMSHKAYLHHDQQQRWWIQDLSLTLLSKPYFLYVRKTASTKVCKIESSIFVILQITNLSHLDKQYLTEAVFTSSKLTDMSQESLW